MTPCPWCRKAEDNPVIKGPPMGGYGDEWDIYQVRCEWCGATGPEASTAEEAVAQWEIMEKEEEHENTTL